MKISYEPVALVALFEAVVVLAMAFGLNLSTEQLGALSAFLVALLAIFVRDKVTPMAKLDHPEEPEYPEL